MRYIFFPYALYHLAEDRAIGSRIKRFALDIMTYFSEIAAESAEVARLDALLPALFHACLNIELVPCGGLAPLIAGLLVYRLRTGNGKACFFAVAHIDLPA